MENPSSDERISCLRRGGQRTAQVCPAVASSERYEFDLLSSERRAHCATFCY